MKTTVLYSSDWTASVCNFLTLPSIGCPSNRLGKSASSLVPVTISEHLTGKLLLRHFSHVRQKWRCYCEVKLIKEECPLIVPVCLSVCVFCSRLSIKVNVCTTGDDGDGGANRCNHKRREKNEKRKLGRGQVSIEMMVMTVMATVAHSLHLKLFARVIYGWICGVRSHWIVKCEELGRLEPSVRTSLCVTICCPLWPPCCTFTTIVRWFVEMVGQLAQKTIAMLIRLFMVIFFWLSYGRLQSISSSIHSIFNNW